MHIPLKVTTDYTLLKSLIKMPDLISFLCDNKINACGICDENLYGVLDFYFSCKKNNIKPIIGLSIKLNNLEVCLYAINYEGYKNLYVMYESKKNIIGSIEMVIGPKKDKTITLSMIKTKEGYRKCGIGQLLVTCCVLYAIDIRYNIAVLGPITGDGIAFWPSLGLTECKKPPQRVLDKILDKQRNLANKLNCTVDPQAILVQYNPVPH